MFVESIESSTLVSEPTTLIILSVDVTAYDVCMLHHYQFLLATRTSSDDRTWNDKTMILFYLILFSLPDTHTQASGMMHGSGNLQFLMIIFFANHIHIFCCCSSSSTTTRDQLNIRKYALFMFFFTSITYRRP